MNFFTNHRIAAFMLLGAGMLMFASGCATNPGAGSPVAARIVPGGVSLRDTVDVGESLTPAELAAEGVFLPVADLATIQSLYQAAIAGDCVAQSKLSRLILETGRPGADGLTMSTPNWVASHILAANIVQRPDDSRPGAVDADVMFLRLQMAPQVSSSLSIRSAMVAAADRLEDVGWFKSASPAERAALGNTPHAIYVRTGILDWRRMTPKERNQYAAEQSAIAERKINSFNPADQVESPSVADEEPVPEPDYSAGIQQALRGAQANVNQALAARGARLAQSRQVQPAPYIAPVPVVPTTPTRSSNPPRVFTSNSNVTASGQSAPDASSVGSMAPKGPTGHYVTLNDCSATEFAPNGYVQLNTPVWANLVYASNGAASLQVKNNDLYHAIYVLAGGTGHMEIDSSTGHTGDMVPPNATHTYPLGYQSNREKVRKAYFSVQYWVKN